MDTRQLVDFLTDAETSLLTAPYFRLRLEEEFKKSWRHGWALALVLFDVDGLDALRAQEGERSVRSALLDIAGEILSASRDTDLSTRLQPGRFAVLLPGADAAGVRVFVERVLGAIVDGAFGRLALHAGAATSPREGLASVDEFLARADSGVSTARAQERNSFVLWEG